MTQRNRNFLYLAGLLALLVLFFSRILFTDKIIRAPDIIAEFYWGAKSMASQPLSKLLRVSLIANWDMYSNSGFTNEGGGETFQFLIPLKLVYALFPFPQSIAWCIVLHLFFGAAGTYFCCRAVGASRLGAMAGGAVFALAPEIASLINAGHVMKIATISYAPWAFYFLERGFQSRRLFFFLTTAFVLAFQFFNTHWQIAFYTCLCIGAYGVARTIGILVTGKNEAKTLFPRLLGLNGALLVFFLTTVSMSLLPLASWSRDTNRGVASGTTQQAGGIQGGLNVDEAMSWSLPPEELATFAIPGMFGLSRQEGGENPKNIDSYYWGRMVFTQTTDYMGLLPWLLLPLPLLFRRDRYTWLGLGGLAGGILFSMGKYTPFYWLLYRFFPGINHFRVPKMMMFIPVIALGVLAARGIDLLREGDVRNNPVFRGYLYGVAAFPAMLLVAYGVARAGSSHWTSALAEMLSQPTRYEQGNYLIAQRWNNLLKETAIAAGFAAVYAVALWSSRKESLARFVPWVLLALFVADTWRINDKFLFLTAAPEQGKEAAATPVQQLLAKMPKTSRFLPMDGSDPMPYIAKGVPVMFTSNAVQQVRWQQFLDVFNLASPMPDMMNVRYMLFPAADYEKQKEAMGGKFIPVLSYGGSVVLENRHVLPKAWLVPSAVVVTDPQQRIGLLSSAPDFDPARVALVESPPPFPMAPIGQTATPGGATVDLYEGNRIAVSATAAANSLLVLGEKYYKGWRATIDGSPAEIVPVDHVLRGVYLTPGNHRIEFRFDPVPFRVGKYLTLTSLLLYGILCLAEVRRRRGGRPATP